jgi:PAS domain S-box-containing protein
MNPLRKLLSTSENVWQSYKSFMESSLAGQQAGTIKDITYWQRQLFTNCLLYSLPISLIAVIPSAIIAYNQGQMFVAAINIVTISSVTLVSFSKHLTLVQKKAFVMCLLTLIAIIVTALMGSFGIGAIYLMAVSVFVSLLFPTWVAYCSVATNFLIYTVFSIIIYFRLFNSLLITRYTIDIWVAYALNFTFLNVMIVLQIRHIINGMEDTIHEEARLLIKLEEELVEKNERNLRLKESAEHYKSFFFLNPSPMWIFDPHTLRFLQVNNAAVAKYGYTQDEFMTMSIKQIRVQENVDDITTDLDDVLNTNVFFQNRTQHRRKNGESFHAEVRCGPITFQGKKVLLAIAWNITKQIEHAQAIEKQNEKLKEIAFMQSHIIRAPLARIMGLTNLITQEIPQDCDKRLFEYLNISVEELDNVIKNIVDHTSEITP